MNHPYGGLATFVRQLEDVRISESGSWERAKALYFKLFDVESAPLEAQLNAAKSLAWDELKPRQREVYLAYAELSEERQRDEAQDRSDTNWSMLP